MNNWIIVALGPCHEGQRIAKIMPVEGGKSVEVSISEKNGIFHVIPVQNSQGAQVASTMAELPSGRSVDTLEINDVLSL